MRVQDLESDAKTKHLGARLRTVLVISREEEEQRSAQECIKDLWRILKEESCGWDNRFTENKLRFVFVTAEFIGSVKGREAGK